MCFLIKNIFGDDKKSYLCGRFFVSNQNFTTEHIENVQNSIFF